MDLLARTCFLTMTFRRALFTSPCTADPSQGRGKAGSEKASPEVEPMALLAGNPATADLGADSALEVVREKPV
ncbi:hypothetical protein BDV93DRAFT_563129 [Ceratobasidium sp. AG-I]|nr:hypothetical protein BDV93DRAFT_563129 [Ceratobasidium sp. AG-I]